MAGNEDGRKGLTRRDFIKGAAAASVAASVPVLRGGARAASPAKQELVTAWDASNTVGWNFHQVSMKTQEKGPMNSCFSGLLEWDKQKADPSLIKPGLAESWDISSDRTVWTFKLREGVKWHNNYGTDWGEFTAEDCEYSLNRGKAGNGKESLGPAKEFKAVDKYTFRVTLERPMDPMDVMMMLSNYHQGYIASKKALEKFAGDAFKPVGTGFMKLDKVAQDTFSEWVRHEQYWEGMPALERHRQLYIKDLSAREMAFEKGEVHMIQGHLSQKWYERSLKLTEAESIVIGPGLLGVLHINTARKPFDDIRVRKALMYAINREALRKFMGLNITREALSPLPSDYIGYTGDVERYQQDPDKARQLLEQAGYGKGLDIEMKVSEIDDYLRPMQVIQQMLKKVGINLELKVITHSAYHQLTREDTNPLVIYGCSRIPTGQQMLNEFYHSRSIIGSPTAITNFSHYKGVDDLLDSASKEYETANKIKYWQQAQKQIMEDAVAYPLYVYMQVWAKKKWVDLGYPFESNLEYSPLLSYKTKILDH